VKLNLGCGNKQRDGFLGVDRYPCDAANLICDVSRTLPFQDDSIDEVYMDNLIEHVHDIPTLMREVVRVSRHGARILIITPHFSSLASWRDPTHVHHLSYFSFDYFEKSSAMHYVGGGLKVVSRKLSFGGGLLGLLGRLICWLNPETYEKKFCFLFRASTLTFYLEVTK
jgi:SAM-dependent methyltransferase